MTIIVSDHARGILVSDAGLADRPSATTTRLGTIFMDASGTQGAGNPQPVYQLMQTDYNGSRTWQQITPDSYTSGYYIDKTDSRATPGAATINKPAGKSAIAVGASSVVITDSRVRTTSIILITPTGRTDTGAEDATALRFWVSAVANGSFTVSTNANATVAAGFNWLVLQ